MSNTNSGRRLSSTLEYGVNAMINSTWKHDSPELQPLLDEPPVSKSTVSQTVFNSINILVGIGILSLPLLFRLGGMAVSIICLIVCALVTQFTASLLARCFIKDNKFCNYTVLGEQLIGSNYNFIILILFNMDLIGAIILLILLFADSFNTILHIDKWVLKILINLILFGLNFTPLNILSYLSLIGIICTNCIIFITLGYGFYNHSLPLSILDPMWDHTLYPTSIQDFLISVSIMMSNFGGHAVLPEFIKDMIDPRGSFKSFRISFGATLMMDLTVLVLVYLMFGNDVQDEFTQNLLLLKEGTWCKIVITLSMGVLPISKLPLITRPIMVYLETQFDTNDSVYVKTMIKAGLSILFILLSLVVNKFGTMMAFLGAFICFTICITLPLLFYLSIFHDELTQLQRSMYVTSMCISVMFTIAGTLLTVL